MLRRRIAEVLPFGCAWRRFAPGSQPNSVSKRRCAFPVRAGRGTRRLPSAAYADHGRYLSPPFSAPRRRFAAVTALCAALGAPYSAAPPAGARFDRRLKRSERCWYPCSVFPRPPPRFHGWISAEKAAGGRNSAPQPPSTRTGQSKRPPSKTPFLYFRSLRRKTSIPHPTVSMSIRPSYSASRAECSAFMLAS